MENHFILLNYTYIFIYIKNKFVNFYRRSTVHAWPAKITAVAMRILRTVNAFLVLQENDARHDQVYKTEMF